MNTTTARRYTCARLTTGEIVPLRKDCGCMDSIHTGPHWLYRSDLSRSLNRPLLDRAQQSADAGNGLDTMLALRGLAIEESARLAELAREFEREGIDRLLTDDDLTAIRAAGEAVDISRPGLRPAIRKLIRLSYADAERYGPDWRTWAGYEACWEWCAVRLAGRAGDKHERFYAKHGPAAYYARINKVRKACGFDPIKGVTT